MKRFYKSVLAISLVSCVSCGLIKKKNIPTANNKNQDIYNFYLSQNLIEPFDCDNGVSSGIAYYITGDPKYWDYIEKSFDNGKPHRTPEMDCYPARSGSTSSRDDLTGKYLGFLKAFHVGNINAVCSILEQHVYFMNTQNNKQGYPFRFADGDKNRTMITPNITYILFNLARKCPNINLPTWLKRYAIHQFNLPFIDEVVPPPGYQQHLMALQALIIIDLGKIPKSVKYYMLAISESEEQKFNGLFKFMKSLFWGEGFQKAQEILEKFMVFDYIHANKYNARDYMWSKRFSDNPAHPDYLNYFPDSTSTKINKPLDRAFLYYLLNRKEWQGINAEEDNEDNEETN